MMQVGMVVPTLGNRPEMLAECLGSLTTQSGARLRIVLVTTAEYADQVGKTFSEMPVIPQHGRGIAAAITTGWRYLGDQVDAVAWLGDDDRLPPSSLRAAVAVLQQRPETVMVYGRSRYIDADGRHQFMLCPGRMGAWMLRLGHNLILQPGCLYRRSAVEAIGGLDHSLRLAFDVDLHRRLMGHGTVRYVPMVLGEIRTHSDSLTVRNRRQSRDEADLVLSRQMPTWARWTRPAWHRASHALLRATVKIGSR
jgi:GT2 family glycosyltransferase